MSAICSKVLETASYSSPSRLNSSRRSFFAAERVDFVVDVWASAPSKWTLGVLTGAVLLRFRMGGTGGSKLKSTSIGPSITVMGLESVVDLALRFLPAAWAGDFGSSLTVTSRRRPRNDIISAHDLSFGVGKRSGILTPITAASLLLGANVTGLSDRTGADNLLLQAKLTWLWKMYEIIILHAVKNIPMDGPPAATYFGALVQSVLWSAS